MNAENPILTIMVALNCEAKPWVDFYNLKKTADKPFSLYSKEGLNVDIVITGIGAIAMSTAVGWIGAQNRVRQRVWLNLGIAGHLNRPVGEVVRTHSFIDSVDLRRYYSPLTAKWGGDTDALMSVNAPTGSYPDEAMVDMEGLAFYKAASLFVSAELIASIKVISDNQDNSVEGLNASKIRQLMLPHVAIVNSFSDKLLALLEPNELKSIELALVGIRATHSQQQQLDQLLGKAAVLKLHQQVAELGLADSLKIEDVLRQLRLLLDGTAPSIGDAVLQGGGHG